MSVLKLKNVCKSYNLLNEKINIIEDINISIDITEKVSLIGQSGSGKSTLLQVCGLLDSCDSGEVFINEKSTISMKDREITNLRMNNIGFVYQYHNLMPEFTAIENVAMPLLIKNNSSEKAYDLAKNALKRLAMENKLNHKSSELSGGEQQRVAIARAIVSKPSIILADEPTGNLDPSNAENVFNFLLEIVSDFNLAMLMVTHNIELAKKHDRVLKISERRILDI